MTLSRGTLDILANSYYISTLSAFIEAFTIMVLFETVAELKVNPFGQRGCFAVRDVAVGEEVGERVSELTSEEEPGWKITATEEVTIPSLLY